MDFLIGLLPERVKTIPVHMDYEGQRKAEKTFQVIIVLFAIVGFIWGYVCQQFSQTVYILGAGFALSSLLTLPPWPIYRIKSLQWQKARPDPATTITAPKTEPQQKNKKKNK